MSAATAVNGKVELVLLRSGDHDRSRHDEYDRNPAYACAPEPPADAIRGEDENGEPNHVTQHRHPHRLAAETNVKDVGNPVGERRVVPIRPNEGQRITDAGP